MGRARGIKLRLDVSAQVASRLADSIDPRDLLELSPRTRRSPETRRTVEHAESRQQALALLLMSPEFRGDDDGLLRKPDITKSHRGGRCCSAARRLPPGLTCRNSRAAADGRDPRLIVVILRGALDGLATVAPTGDPDYAALHGSIALTSNGPHAALMLDSFFALHPRCRSSRGCIERKRAACFMRWQRPIATVRISTDRTCSKAALPEMLFS